MYMEEWIVNMMVVAKWMFNIFFSLEVLNLKTRAKVAGNRVAEYKVREVMEDRVMDYLLVMMAVVQVLDLV